MRTSPSRYAGALAGVALVAGALTAGCTASGEVGGPPSSRTTTDPTANPTPTSTPSVSPVSPVSPGTSNPMACAAKVTAAMTRDQRIGQLLMVGFQAGQRPAALSAVLTQTQVGAVIYLGGWQDAAVVAAASKQLQASAPGPAGLLIAADQEGGAVRQLRGAGFTQTPNALAQGRLTPQRLAGLTGIVAAELTTAGVNTNLAPVADVVPAGKVAVNRPIGFYSRQYGSDPEQVAAAVTTVVQAYQSRGVIATVKHFPGLGRITGNTDTTTDGITDELTGPDDPYLGPFRAAIAGDVGMVMVSSARYPRIDPDNQAVFSRAVVTDLLRTRLGYAGVVITDDVGAARAVAAVPVGDRAVRFVAAGGDIVLTAVPAHAGVMAQALRTRAESDPAFAGQVDAAALRVLSLKGRFGLLHCG